MKKLSEVAMELAENNVPASCWDDEEGKTQTGHWSGTKADAETALGRPLTSEEVTLLSLGREFGPTPALEDEVAKRLMKALWPEGNNRGSWYNWAILAQRLQGLGY